MMCEVLSRSLALFTCVVRRKTARTPYQDVKSAHHALEEFNGGELNDVPIHVEIIDEDLPPEDEYYLSQGYRDIAPTPSGAPAKAVTLKVKQELVEPVANSDASRLQGGERHSPKPAEKPKKEQKHRV